MPLLLSQPFLRSGTADGVERFWQGKGGVTLCARRQIVRAITPHVLFARTKWVAKRRLAAGAAGQHNGKHFCSKKTWFSVGGLGMRRFSSNYYFIIVGVRP